MFKLPPYLPASVTREVYVRVTNQIWMGVSQFPQLPCHCERYSCTENVKHPLFNLPGIDAVPNPVCFFGSSVDVEILSYIGLINSTAASGCPRCTDLAPFNNRTVLVFCRAGDLWASAIREQCTGATVYVLGEFYEYPNGEKIRLCEFSRSRLYGLASAVKNFQFDRDGFQRKSGPLSKLLARLVQDPKVVLYIGEREALTTQGVFTVPSRAFRAWLIGQSQERFKRIPCAQVLTSTVYLASTLAKGGGEL